MARTTRISKWGSSLAVRIPKAVAEEWGVKEGSTVEMSQDAQGIHLRKRKYDLEEMVASLENAELHPEIDTGTPRGNEIWSPTNTSTNAAN